MSVASATLWWTHHRASPGRQLHPNLMGYEPELIQRQDRATRADGLRKRPAMQERQLRETRGAALPAAVGVALVDLVHTNTGHWRTKIATYFRQQMSVAEVRSCFNNCFRAW